MSVIRYMCEGDCQTKVTVEEFKQGKNSCLTKNCQSYSQKLERGEYCPSCNTSFEEGDNHICF